jgi:hypothetical protein
LPPGAFVFKFVEEIVTTK